VITGEVYSITILVIHFYESWFIGFVRE